MGPERGWRACHRATRAEFFSHTTPAGGIAPGTIPTETQNDQEIASIHVREGQEALFEAGVAQARPLFLRARGCHDMQLYRSIEQPQRYTLVVDWETVENHMVDFRESTDFQEWRKLVAGFFVEPPQVHHEQKVL